MSEQWKSSGGFSTGEGDLPYRGRNRSKEAEGKIKPFFGEMERRILEFGSVKKFIPLHSVIKPPTNPDFDKPVNVLTR